MAPNTCLFVTAAIFIAFHSASCRLSTKRFPETFKFGVGSSAYRTEGAWDTDGKGENIWDRYVHKNNLSGGDVASDHYHKHVEDVALLKHLGVNFYRFSISWSRILPTGFSYKVNQKGIKFYSDLIDLLVENGVAPMVTIFDWDTPTAVEDLGGFSNVLVADWFEDYAKILFENFGDRVKHWITFNEPKEMCLRGYGEGLGAPGRSSSGIGDYMCAHSVLKAHARVYHLYDDFFRGSQKGKISIALGGTWFEAGDQKAALRMLDFSFGWFAEPIFGANGDYPTIMKDWVKNKSEEEGFFESRLPSLTKEEIGYIKGTADFLALAHYTTLMAEENNHIEGNGTSYKTDHQVKTWSKDEWRFGSTESTKVVPWGFKKLLKWLKTKYDDPEIVVTGNGFADSGELDDQARINYHKLYLNELLTALEEGVRISAYAISDFLDGFDWYTLNYRNKFGLVHVDFSHPARTRTPKSSATFYKNLIETKELQINKSPKHFPSFYALLGGLFLIWKLAF